MLRFFSHTIYLAFTFQRSEVRTYSKAKENNIFFVIKMFRLLVTPFVIKLDSRVTIFTKTI